MNTEDLTLFLIQLANFQYFLAHGPQGSCFYLLLLWISDSSLAYLCGFRALARSNRLAILHV